MMEKGNDLIAGYLANKTEESFRAIVSEHSAMVMATASRRLNGDRALAQDVSQQVFIRLARSAHKLNSDICLAGWLYCQTCRISTDVIRSESSRQKRESAAASLVKNESNQAQQNLIGDLDEALGQLNDRDREAIVLRFLEERSHRGVGESLGISEEAARKRCARAVESLRAFFAKPGSTVTTTAVAAALTGLSSPRVSAATIEVISQSAFQKSGTSIVGGGLVTFLSGLAITAVASVGVFSYQQSQATSVQAKSHSTNPEASQRDRRVSNSQINDGLSVEDLIAEIRLLYLEPRNQLMKLRMAALFEVLPVADRGEFLRQSSGILSSDEQRFAYLQFLEYWIADDAWLAFDAILSERFISGAFAKDLGQIEVLFRSWNKSAPDDAEAWLRKNWGHEDLRIQAFDSTIQGAFLQYFVTRELGEHGVEAAFSKARSFGKGDDVLSNFSGLTGTRSTSTSTRHFKEIYQHIRDLPIGKLKDGLTDRILKSWKHKNSAHFIKSLESLTKAERIPAALTLLTYIAPTETKVKQATGGVITSFQYPNYTPDEKAALIVSKENEVREWAAEIGMDEELIERKIIETYLGERNRRCVPLIGNLTSGPENDQILDEVIRYLCEKQQLGSAKSEVKAFEVALKIYDSKTRLNAVWSLYRRIQVIEPEVAEEMLTDQSLPGDVASALHEMATTLSK